MANTVAVCEARPALDAKQSFVYGNRVQAGCAQHASWSGVNECDAASKAMRRKERAEEELFQVHSIKKRAMNDF